MWKHWFVNNVFKWTGKYIVREKDAIVANGGVILRQEVLEGRNQVEIRDEVGLAERLEEVVRKLSEAYVKILLQ